METLNRFHSHFTDWKPKLVPPNGHAMALHLRTRGGSLQQAGRASRLVRVVADRPIHRAQESTGFLAERTCNGAIMLKQSFKRLSSPHSFSLLFACRGSMQAHRPICLVTNGPTLIGCTVVIGLATIYPVTHSRHQTKGKFQGFADRPHHGTSPTQNC
jgi:hypothetical protein